MTDQEEKTLEGFEYDWLVSDLEGRVAMMSTVGGGYYPKTLLDDSSGYERAIERILTLQASCEALRAPELRDGYENPWKRMAERGVHAFESDPNGGPYLRVAAPRKEILLLELPPDVRDIAARVRLTLNLSRAEEVSTDAILTAERLGHL